MFAMFRPVLSARIDFSDPCARIDISHRKCGGSIFYPEVKIYYYLITGSNEEIDPLIKSTMC